MFLVWLLNNLLHKVVEWKLAISQFNPLTIHFTLPSICVTVTQPLTSLMCVCACTFCTHTLLNASVAPHSSRSWLSKWRESQANGLDVQSKMLLFKYLDPLSVFSTSFQTKTKHVAHALWCFPFLHEGCVSCRQQPSVGENLPHSCASEKLSHQAPTGWMRWLRESWHLIGYRCSGFPRLCWLPLLT